MSDLQDARQALWDVVDGIPEAQLHRKNADGWSVLDVLEHLHLMEQAIAGTIVRVVKSDAIEDIPVVQLKGVLNRTVKIQAPSYVAPTGAFTSLTAAKSQLAATRQAFLDTIAAVSDDDALTHGFNHIVFGMLSIRQWIDLVALHERRHILQIQEMIAEA